MHSGEVTALKWKPFECPHCHVTFEKDWVTARFRPYPTFASVYNLRWTAFPEDASNPTDLARKADEALYLAKQGGRNRVAHAAAVSSRP